MSHLAYQNDYQDGKPGSDTKKEDFEGFFRLFYPDLCNYVHGYVKNRAVAKDIVQTVFLKVWEQKDFWDDIESAKAYLYKSVRNEALNHQKHQQVKRESSEELQKRIVEWKKSHAHPEAEKDEKIALIQEGIKNLPNRCEEIFRLSRESGMTYKEIAEILDISIKTVETQMGRAFKKLRAFTSRYWDQSFLLVFALII